MDIAPALRKISVAFAFALKTATAIAGEYTLYQSNGQPVADYTEFVAQLKAGDRVVVDEGVRYEITGKLGEGTTTRVFEARAIAPSGPHPSRVALRLPMAVGVTPFEKRFTYKGFMDYFISAHRSVFRAGVAPAMYGSATGRYAAVEIIREVCTFDEFLAGSPKVAAGERGRAAAAFRDFAAKLAVFDFIADFKPHQIVYDGDRWVLLDWSGARLLDGELGPDDVVGRHPFSTEQWKKALDAVEVPSHLEAEAVELVKSAEGRLAESRREMMKRGQNPVSMRSLTVAAVKAAPAAASAACKPESWAGMLP